MPIKFQNPNKHNNKKTNMKIQDFTKILLTKKQE